MPRDLKRQRSPLAELLIEYRNNALLSQQQLSDLTYALAAGGDEMIPHGIQRPMIARAEGTLIPMPETLVILSYTLSYALREQGFEGATGDQIYNHLAKSIKKKLTARDVSPHAAEIDAILSPLAATDREIIYEGLKANARALANALTQLRRRKEAQRRRASEGDVPPSNPA